MKKDSRKGVLFGVGLLLGVAAGAVGMMSLRGGDGPYASSPGPSTGTMGAASASTAFVNAVAGNCEMAPMLPGTGNGDGSESLQSKPGAASADEVASLILSGKEAAAAGRQRDAEINFLNACRNAATLKDGDPVPLSDAMYQLGRHYANVAAHGTPAKGQELFRRSERLYSASLEGFRARYGEDHEKTKFAREGLITVQQATGGKAPTAVAKAPPPPPAPAPAPAPVAQPAPEPAAAAPAAPTAAAPVPAPAPAPVRQEAVKAPEPAAPAARQEVVRAPAEPAAPAAAPAPREERKAAAPVRRPRAEPEETRPRESAPAPAVAEQRPAAPRVERRTEPAPAIAEPAEPRPQARRTPPRDVAPREAAPREAAPAEDLAIEALPAQPRRPRPAPVITEPDYAPPPPPPDYSSSGAGPAPDAEGSPSSP